MDESKTTATPKVASPGVEETFNLAGTWKIPVHVSYIFLEVEMYGQIAHTETFAEEKDIAAGDWSYSAKFVPPSVGENTKVALALYAMDATNTALFEIDTEFTLSPHAMFV